MACQPAQARSPNGASFKISLRPADRPECGKPRVADVKCLPLTAPMQCLCQSGQYEGSSHGPSENSRRPCCTCLVVFRIKGPAL